MRCYEVELTGWIRVGAVITVEATSEDDARKEAFAEAQAFTFIWDHTMYSQQAINVEVLDVNEEKP